MRGIFEGCFFRPTIARLMITAAAIAGLMAAGCLQVRSQPPVPPTTMSSWVARMFLDVFRARLCGKATLSDGTAS